MKSLILSLLLGLNIVGSIAKIYEIPLHSQPPRRASQTFFSNFIQSDETSNPPTEFILQSDLDTSYYGTIYIGENKQSFDMIFATTSWFVVVPSSSSEASN